MKIYISLFIVLTFGSVAIAQNTKDKLELGVQTTSLTLFHPDFPGDETQPGIGGRITYNFNRSFAAEAEINFFPQKPLILQANGSAVQGQFGIKAGKRFEKFGVFAKARPGFLTVGDVFSLQPAPPDVNGGVGFKNERTTFFTMDVGGVLELYPSRRSVVRFDAGDTVVRHPEFFTINFFDGPILRRVRGPKFNHNFQFTAGIAFRLGEFPDAESNVKSSVDQQQGTPRFEVGAQFTSLFVDPPTRLCAGICVSGDSIHTEPGVGGRFTFNLTDNIAVEAEGNYFTRDRLDLPNPSGHMFQGQFGAKIGKRFEKWGLFGKARPGFVGFTEVNELAGTRSIVFLGQTFEVGEFRVVKKFYPSIDIGGVVEFYISRRWMARFDIGDTIIRYGEIEGPGFSLSNAIVRRPPETRHNLQVTSGIGFRF